MNLSVLMWQSWLTLHLWLAVALLRQEIYFHSVSFHSEIINDANVNNG